MRAVQRVFLPTCQEFLDTSLEVVILNAKLYFDIFVD